MMPTTEPPARPAFWRCSRCKTPNPWAVYITACIGCGAARPAIAPESRAEPGPVGPVDGRRAPAPRLLATAVAYGLVLIAVTLLARVVGDGWWPGLAILLSPRWIFLAPILPLAAWAWRSRRRVIGVVIAFEALFILGPLMGFSVPFGRLGPDAAGPRLRIMTFNRGGGRIDAEGFGRYLDRHKIDVVCFQEFHGDPALDAALAGRGWSTNGARSIASRHPIVRDFPRSPEHNLDEFRYNATLYRARIKGPEGRELVVGSIHMPTLRPGFLGILRGKVRVLVALLDWWNEELGRMLDLLNESGGGPTLIGGDFNNVAEASALVALREQGAYQSAFEQAGLGWGYTRPAALPWVRIDHILASPEWAVTACWVGPAFGSDHRSLVAEVALRPADPARP